MNDKEKKIGIAATTRVRTIFGAGSEKTKPVETITNRHSVTCFDFSQNKKTWPKVKENIIHDNINLIELGFRPDSYLNTENESLVSVLVCNENQQVLAAVDRKSEPLWIEVKNLIPGKNVLRLGYKTDKDPEPWAEIIWSGVSPKRYLPPDTPVHELVIIGFESYLVKEVVCRTSYIPDVPKPKKRLLYPLKKYPHLNFVPQPKTLSLAQAEIWYRKSSMLLSKSVFGYKTDLEKLNLIIDLKIMIRDVAAKSVIETKFKNEFIKKHRTPNIDELILTASPSAFEIESAIEILNAPGKRHYSEFADGMESHRVWSENGDWEFDGEKWIQVSDDK